MTAIYTAAMQWPEAGEPSREPRITRRLYADDFAPPSEWDSFALKLMGERAKQKAVRALTDDELCWVKRAIDAELNRRRKLAWHEVGWLIEGRQ